MTKRFGLNYVPAGEVWSSAINQYLINANFGYIEWRIQCNYSQQDPSKWYCIITTNNSVTFERVNGLIQSFNNANNAQYPNSCYITVEEIKNPTKVLFVKNYAQFLRHSLINTHFDKFNKLKCD